MIFKKYLNLFCRDNFRQYQNSYLSNLTIYNKDQIMNYNFYLYFNHYNAKHIASSHRPLINKFN